MHRSMCFSASASFVAGASLTVIGGATLAKTKERKEIPYAAIPALFGIQQLLEGIVWLSFGPEDAWLHRIAIYGFLFFAYVLWPAYVPFSIGLLETIRWRKTFLQVIQFIGLGVGLYLAYFLGRYPATCQISGNHLVYGSPATYFIPLMGLYLLATCCACFLSSRPRIRLFGFLAFASFVFTYFFYEVALASVWCFFAAILSVTVWYHFHDRKSVTAK